MHNNIKIAIIEDDENLRFLIVHRLESLQYQVIQAANGVDGERIILEQKPDIVLLDWMLPGRSGDEVCLNLRKEGFNNMVIMMTAKSQDVDKIDAYSVGVSDYITKPFNMDVLVAMIENKAKYFIAQPAEDLSFGNTQHQPSTHMLIRDGKRIELTILENRILLYFLQNLDRVISREELMEVVWGYTSNVNTRTLDMHIVRLRKKIEENPDKPRYLVTVRGMGYKFMSNPS